MPMNDRRIGSLTIFSAAVLWSFGGLLGKAISLNGLSIAILRGGISALTIGLYRKSWRVHLSRSVLIAGISLSLTTLLYMMANKLTTAANAIVLQYTSPIYIIVFAWIFYKQKPKRDDVIALLFVLFGLLIFFSRELSGGHLLGDALGLLSGLSFAGVFFANKMKDANPVDAVYLGNVLNFLLLPLIFFDDQLYHINAMDITLLLIMGIFQLGIAYILFSKGIQKISATHANIIAIIEPILNPVWVFIFLDELPNAMALMGGAVVLVTILIYNQSQMKKAST